MAKKQKPQAMVTYNSANDSFDLYIRSDEKDNWGFSLSAKCWAAEGETETNLIHFSFLKEVLKCLKLGFEVFEGKL